VLTVRSRRWGIETQEFSRGGLSGACGHVRLTKERLMLCADCAQPQVRNRNSEFSRGGLSGACGHVRLTKERLMVCADCAQPQVGREGLDGRGDSFRGRGDD